jgi:hypothetical protein
MLAHETLRVLVFHEEDSWIAQCLEHDVCVQAPDLDQLQSRLETAIFLELGEGNPSTSIGHAPPAYFEMWDRARELGGAPTNTSMRIAA